MVVQNITCLSCEWSWEYEMRTKLDSEWLRLSISPHRCGLLHTRCSVIVSFSLLFYFLIIILSRRRPCTCSWRLPFFLLSLALASSFSLFHFISHLHSFCFCFSSENNITRQDTTRQNQNGLACYQQEQHYWDRGRFIRCTRWSGFDSYYFLGFPPTFRLFFFAAFILPKC